MKKYTEQELKQITEAIIKINEADTEQYVKTIKEAEEDYNSTVGTADQEMSRDEYLGSVFIGEDHFEEWLLEAIDIVFDELDRSTHAKVVTIKENMKVASDPNEISFEELRDITVDVLKKNIGKSYPEIKQLMINILEALDLKGVMEDKILAENLNGGIQYVVCRIMEGADEDISDEVESIFTEWVATFVLEAEETPLEQVLARINEEHKEDFERTITTMFNIKMMKDKVIAISLLNGFLITILKVTHSILK